MAFDFPNAPTVGQVYQGYTWDGEKWNGTVAGPAALPPLMDGVAAVGVSMKYTREDHIHPSDTSRAPVANPVFTGSVTIPAPSQPQHAARKADVDANVPVGFVHASGDTMTGQLTCSTNLGGGLGGTAASPCLMVLGGPGGADAWMTFHRPGYFAVNLGLSSDGNFYYGGFSFGAGVAYRFYTTRDGGMVTNARIATNADYQIPFGSGMVEPLNGGVVTGLANLGGGIFIRIKQLQILLNGAWGVVGYA